MYGPEYLDWLERCKAGERIDAFLASLDAEDRKWVLAVLRERQLPSAGALSQLASQSLALDRQRRSQGRVSSLGGGLGSLLG